MARSRFVFACAALLALPAWCQQGDDRKYGIREDTPRTGSLIRKDEVTSSRLPINKRYDELTPDERQQLYRLYERIEPGDEPPFPADGLKPILDALRKAQAKRLVKGRLTLIVTVDPSGEASEVKVVQSPDDNEMTRFATAVLMLTKYKPAVCAAQPCRMDYPFTMDFSVR